MIIDNQRVHKRTLNSVFKKYILFLNTIDQHQNKTQTNQNGSLGF